MDVLTKKQRSFCMSQIKGKNTKPELLLRKVLSGMKLRYRIHFDLFGKPDIVFTKAKLAVFIDGCFWHGCPVHGYQPKTNAEFWKAKIERNKTRDINVNMTLRDLGWETLRFWEHEIKQDAEGAAANIMKRLFARERIWMNQKK